MPQPLVDLATPPGPGSQTAPKSFRNFSYRELDVSNQATLHPEANISADLEEKLRLRMPRRYMNQNAASILTMLDKSSHYLGIFLSHKAAKIDPGLSLLNLSPVH